MGVREVVESTWHGRASGVLGLGLRALALPYGAAVAIRNHAFDTGWRRPERVPARVVSVGNVVVGGSGKTPFTLWLAQRLAAAGHRPAIVARGYGRQASGVVIVGNEGRAWVSAAHGGDEAVLMACRFAGPVVTDGDRVAAARTAIERFGVDTIVLDDGFQHRRLARDVDIVLLATAIENAHVLPAGPLREPVRALGRAHLIAAMPGVSVPSVGCPIHRIRFEPEALVRLSGEEWRIESIQGLRGRAVTAVAGIARPERFVRDLRDLGADVVTTITRPDHHPWTPAEVHEVFRCAEGSQVVTTEKDLVKWPSDSAAEAIAVRVGVHVENAEEVLRLAGGASMVCE